LKNPNAVMEGTMAEAINNFGVTVDEFKSAMLEFAFPNTKNMGGSR